MTKKTIFLKDLTPILNVGDKLGWVKPPLVYTKKDFHLIKRNNPEQLIGLFSSLATYCVIIAALDRDENYQVNQIAMQHFPGGINQETLDDFNAQLDNFSDKKELIVYMGSEYRGIESPSQDQCIADLQTQFKLSYKHANLSCCVTFDGQVGSFAYGSLKQPVNKTYIIRQFSSNEIEKEFKLLIDHFPDLITQEKLKNLQNNILLGSPSIDVAYDLLDKTRRLIITATYVDGINKKALYERYVTDVNQLRKLSNLVKKTCLILSATIIGIIPALIISMYNFWSITNKQIKTLDEVRHCLEENPATTNLFLLTPQ